MRLLPVLRLFALVLLFVGEGGAAVMAQSGYPQQGYRDPRAYPPGYYPGKLVQPAQPAPQQGFSIRRLFGTPETTPAPTPRPVAKPRRTAPPPVVRQEKPKQDPSAHIVVFGDALADFARQGLDDIFAEDEDVAVVPKIRNDISLVRGDPTEWPNFISATLDGGQKITLAVMMMGSRDRQPLKEGEENIEALSERWKDLYGKRVDAILQTLQGRGIPVVWIGLPPMKNGKISADLVAMNEIYRESVERHGGAYVDVWPGFVDDENHYTATGPTVSGDIAKLRAGDGVSFTKAGARKLAHFADAEIKRILSAAQNPAPATAMPTLRPNSPEGEAGPSIEAALPAVPDAATPAAPPEKPVAGPVLPLTRPDVAPGGALVSGPPKLNNDQAHSVQRALRSGIAPSVRPGRADDFRWPPS